MRLFVRSETLGLFSLFCSSSKERLSTNAHRLRAFGSRPTLWNYCSALCGLNTIPRATPHLSVRKNDAKRAIESKPNISANPLNRFFLWITILCDNFATIYLFQLEITKRIFECAQMNTESRKKRIWASKQCASQNKEPTTTEQRERKRGEQENNLAWFYDR